MGHQQQHLKSFEVPPGLPVVAIDLAAGSVCGITVEFGPVPDHLDGATSVGTAVEATDTKALVRLLSMRLIVEDGSRIVVDHEPSDDETATWFALYGWAASLVMLQRGHYFLHASTVSKDDRVIALTGKQGAGKSTTALELVKRGWTLGCDDTTPITVVDGTAWVTPYERPIHLLPGGEGRNLTWSHNLPFRAKQAFSAQQDLQPRPLTGVVELLPGATVDHGVELMPMTGAVSVAMLERNIHAWRAARTPGRRSSLMAWLTGVASAAPAFQIARPADTDSLSQVGDLIEQFCG